MIEPSVIVGRTKNGMDFIGTIEESKVLDIFWIFDEMTVNGWNITLRPVRSMFFNVSSEGKRIRYNINMTDVLTYQKLLESRQNEELKQYLNDVYIQCKNIDAISSSSETDEKKEI